jgi:hypothetical protein
MNTEYSIYIETRSRYYDYRFLGEEPKERWWTEYRDKTSFEDTTILVHYENNKLKFYLSAIPSNRKDKVNTIIRYTIVIEGDYNNELGILVSEICRDVLEQSKNSNKIKGILDDLFDEDCIEKMIAKNNNIELLDRKFDELKKNLNKSFVVSIESNRLSSDEEKIYLLDRNNGESLEDFYNSIREINPSSNKSQKTLYLNLINSIDKENEYLEMADIVYLLITSETEFIDGHRQEVKKKIVQKDQPLKQTNMKMISTVLLILLVVITLMVLILYLVNILINGRT